MLGVITPLEMIVGKEKWITICSVNWYSCVYLRVLFANLLSKAGCKEALKLLVIDNTNGNDKLLYELLREYPLEIIKNDPGNLTGSYGHASGLNTAMNNIATQYGLIVDPDVYVFKKNWDLFLIDLLDKEQAVAAGVAYPAWQLGKYHNFPSPVFCFFHSKQFGMLNPDWAPFEGKKNARIWDFIRRNILRGGIIINRKAYEKSSVMRKIGTRLEKVIGVCSKDTGWINAKKAAEREVKAITFQTLVKDAKNVNERFRNLADHFELYMHEDKPILAHKYSSAGKLWSTQKGRDDVYWRKCITQAEAARDFWRS